MTDTSPRPLVHTFFVHLHIHDALTSGPMLRTWPDMCTRGQMVDVLFDAPIRGMVGHYQSGASLEILQDLVFSFNSKRGTQYFDGSSGNVKSYLFHSSLLDQLCPLVDVCHFRINSSICSKTAPEEYRQNMIRNCY